MRYYRRNALIIEYPTTVARFGTCPVTAKMRWNVAWTELGFEKVKFIPKGTKLQGKLGERGMVTRRDLILIDLDCSKEQFIDSVARYFSLQLNVNVHALRFKFEKYQPFGNLNER